MIKVSAKNNNLYISGITCLDLAKTLDCGQAFRFSVGENGIWQGVVKDKYIRLEMKDGVLVLYNTSLTDYQKIWKPYFDLDRDYEKIIDEISDNEVIKKATDYGRGIRILRQDSWETLCSFILSQNNNVPRIKGIIERLCKNFGDDLGDGNYSFPTAQKLSALSLEDLEVLRSGFRAKYVLDAAKKVASGEIDLEKLKLMPTDEARGVLTTIYGVGDKVADCTLLFGLHKIDAFPKDVWIKRVMEKWFNGGELPQNAKKYAGIVQQYLFYYAWSNRML